MASFSIISAYNNHHVIGKDGDIPWHEPEDLKLFKHLTQRCVLIMGRKTWDSLPVKPLPKRHTIILSSSRDESYTNFNGDFLTESSHVSSVPEAIRHALNVQHWNSELDNEIFICGGQSIYEQFLPYCSTAYLSHIDNDSDGDTYLTVLSSIQNNFKLNFENRYDNFRQHIYIRR